MPDSDTVGSPGASVDGVVLVTASRRSLLVLPCGNSSPASMMIICVSPLTVEVTAAALPP